MFIGILFSFASITLISWLVLSYVFSPDRLVSKRLSQLKVYEKYLPATEEEEKSFSERVIIPLLSRILLVVSRFSPVGMNESIKQRLNYAGNPRGMDADKFISIKILSVFFAALFMLFIWSVMPPIRPSIFLISFIILPASFFIPDAWLSSIAEKRQKKIWLALPDTIDLLTVGVEAGLAFDSAIAKVIKRGIGPLGEELAKMLQEMQMGFSRKDAFKNLASRVTSPEFHAFIMSMVQADVFGISVGQVLKTQAKEMRLKRRQHAEEKAMKTPVKIVFPVVLCIFPALMMVIVGPAILRVFSGFSNLP